MSCITSVSPTEKPERTRKPKAQLVGYDYLLKNWREFVVRPQDMRRYKTSELSSTLFCGGLYFLYLGDELRYIGKSVQLGQRLSKHAYQRHMDFDSFSVLEIDVPDAAHFLEHVEHAYIHALTPPENMSYLARGFKNEEKMRQMIREAWAIA